MFKTLVFQILSRNKVDENRQNDIVIFLWAFIHGLTSLAAMKNVKYENKWNLKLHDLFTVFDCKELVF